MHTDALPDLRGRVAIVTGGSRGIGMAAAAALSESGASVALVARDARALTEAAGKIPRRDARVITMAGSVDDRAFGRTVVERVERELGPVAILVNAAAIQGPIGPLESIDAAALEQTMRVNFLGTVWMMQAVLPGMRARRAGAIVNLSGGGATSPRERFSAYAASKVAVVRVSEIAAREYAGDGIRVNAVSPGGVNTRMTDEIERAGATAGDAAQQEVRAQRASGGVDPRVSASLIAWLASDAAAHISGRLISAVHDDWRGLIAARKSPSDPDAMTLRRR